MISIDFTDQRVLVVGGTSGINRGIAEAFAVQKARVAVASRSQDKVDDTVAALGSAGANDTFGFSADVRDFDAVSAGVQQVADRWGGIDVLVSGAAGNFPALAADMSSNAFKSVVDIDLLGTFNVLRAAYPSLSKPGATVINISAPQAFIPLVAQSHVCAAKAGVDMVTKTFALEWGVEGIRVNSVIPGPIADTEGMKRLAPTPELVESCRQSVPLKRLGQANDVAQACLFLASPMASYVSGVILPVDGAWSLGGVAALGSKMAKFLIPEKS